MTCNENRKLGREMKRLELKKWWVLCHLTDQQLEELEYVHVYGSDRCSSESLSALMITKGNQDVYGAGFNSMVGSTKSPVKIQNVEEMRDDENIKIEELCGIGLKKIVVGFEFGAGLTNENELYLWGEGPDIVVSKARSVCYEVYSTDASCSKCGETYTSFEVGRFHLNKCNKCNFLPSYNRSPPPTGILLRRFVMAYHVFVSCLSCGKICQSLHVGEYDLNYCQACDLLREVSFRDVPSKSSLSPRKIELPETVEILDIECGRSFLLLRTLDNRLFVWGSLGSSYYKCCVQNPDNIIIRSVSCGGNHIAVLSRHGDVYTCGSGKFGQLGYTWDELDGHITLRKVALPGRAVKVSCRCTGTTCLLNDHSIYCWGSHLRHIGRTQNTMRLTHTNYASDIIATPVRIKGQFSDIESSPLTNLFCAKTEPFVFSWGSVKDQRSRYRQQLKVSASECLSAFVDRPVTYSSSAPNRSCVFIRHFIPQCTIHSQFYGSTLFSDLLLKLSDGELPAHSLVLHANSVYFKNLFSEAEKVPTEIDVSSYNPVAYRNLLKHLYGVEVTDGRYEDLFDLYALAISYNETGIVEATFSRLREALDERNVLAIHAKAKAASFHELVEECEQFMDSPEYKNMLVKLVTRDSQKSLQALAMIMEDTVEGDR